MNTENRTGKEHEMKTSKKELTKPSLREKMRQAELKCYGHEMRREESDPFRLPKDRGGDKA